MSLDPVILGFLRYAPLTGYQLKREADCSVGAFWTVSYGGLYPALARLLEQGDISIHSETGDSRTYQITEQGRTRFRRWLLGSTAKPAAKDEFWLKIFYATDDELPALEGMISKRTAELSKDLEQLRMVAREATFLGQGQVSCLQLGLSDYENQLKTLTGLLEKIASDLKQA